MKKGFTLIELLIVIGVLAILATSVVLVLNPAQMIAQARDSQRISDLSSIKSAIALYLTTAASPALTASTTCTATGCVSPFANAFVVGSETLLNPGFETPGANWSGGYTDETTFIHSGSHAIKLVSTNVNWYTPQALQSPTVTAGQLYQLSFWARGDGTNDATYGVYDVTHSVYLISGPTHTGITGTTYTQYATTFTTPAGCTTVALFLTVNQAAGATAYFDDVSLKQVISAVPPVVTTSTAVNGTGWVGGVDFTKMSGGSPLAALPLDPINNSTYYYAYQGTTSNTFKLAGRLESTKYQPKMVSDGGTQNTCVIYTESTCFYEVGTDLSL